MIRQNNPITKPSFVGVTGPICGGKSRIAKAIKKLGFHFVDSDSVAKNFVYDGSDEHNEYLKIIFGEEVFKEDGSYDFDVIRSKFFDTTEVGKNTRDLFYEFFKHGIWQEIEKEAKKSGKLFVFIENAVLFEYEWERYFNIMICVHCTEEESRKRFLNSRKGIPLDIFENIMKTQLPAEEKVKRSHYSIDTTNVDEVLTIEAVMQLLNTIGIAT